MSNQETPIEQFGKAKGEYPETEDQEMLKQREKEYENSQALAKLMHSQEGSLLMKWLNDQIMSSLLMLFKTREERYISDLQAYFELKQKLTNAEKVKESIESWLSEI